MIHSDYNPTVMDNNIALLQLESPLTYTNYIQPISMPKPFEKYSGPCTSGGWGASVSGIYIFKHLLNYEI